MRSLINHLGPDFLRVRLGIGRPPGRMPTAAYVLQDFGQDEQEIVAIMLAEAADAVRSILRDGIDNAMNQHNKRPNSAESSSV
jgi:PTH1 family peptidyl-tRNA hydrolase